MDPLSISGTVFALLETSIGIIGRLRVAYSRQRAQASLLEQHHRTLYDTQSIIQLVHNQECLHTVAITSGLVKMKELSQELLALLKLLDPGHKSVPRQIAHQLISGSKDEGDLDRIVDRMNSTKSNLSLHIQVAGVGLTSDSQSKIVANTAQINQLDQTIRELLGEGRGLKIASLLKNHPRREDGTVVLDPEELTQIGVIVPKNGTSRNISDNLTRLQALQINAPIGEDEWKTISCLEIRDNEAGPASSQVNYPISGTVFTSLLFDHSIKYILLFVLIYLPFNYFFRRD